MIHIYPPHADIHNKKIQCIKQNYFRCQLYMSCILQGKRPVFSDIYSYAPAQIQYNIARNCTDDKQNKPCIYISEICGSGAISTCPIHGMATAQTTNPQSAIAIITIFNHFSSSFCLIYSPCFSLRSPYSARSFF